MNKHQKMVTKLAKINMEMHKINFLKARRKANRELLEIKDMLVDRYGFSRK